MNGTFGTASTTNTAGATPSPTGYASLQRGLQIVALVQDNRQMRVAEIAESLDLPVSTVYRYAAALSRSGFVSVDDGTLIPTARLAERAGQDPHLVEIAGAVIRRLRDQTGMTALVLVRVHTMALCIEVAASPRRHRIFFARGQVRPLHAGASVLPLLAFAPPPVVQEVLRGGLPQHTSLTPTAATLPTLLRRVHERRLAVSRGQVTPGLVALGVPVVVQGRCVCSLSLVGEESDLPVGSPTQTRIQQLRAAAAALESTLPTTIAGEEWSNAER